MGIGFAPTWLRQASPPPAPLLHKSTLTTAIVAYLMSKKENTAIPLNFASTTLLIRSISLTGLFVRSLNIRLVSLPALVRTFATAESGFNIQAGRPSSYPSTNAVTALKGFRAPFLSTHDKILGVGVRILKNTGCA